MKFQPLSDRVLVRRFESSERSKGGLYIPEAAKEKPFEAEVLAVGAGRVLENGSLLPMNVKVGDKVYINKYSGSTIKVEGEEFLVLREEEILGVSV